MPIWPALHALTTQLAWPGECTLCGDWGPHTICPPCLAAWAPPAWRCQRCAMPWPHHDQVQGFGCPECEVRTPEFDRAVAAVHYAAPWSQLIARLKFQGRSELAPALGRLLARAVQARPAHTLVGLPDVVLPMPLSAQRLQERGFNQSWLLARACAGMLNLPCRHDVLRRTRHTERLMQLSAEDRALVLMHAFDVAPSQAHQVRGAHVALVDDVLTTGATMDAACRALREAGARSISAWVVARTGLPQ